MRKLLQGIFPTSIKFLMLPIMMRFFLGHRIGCRLMGYKFFGLNGVDKQLIEVIGNKPGYFVEIGANDGFTASNTKHLELFHGWKGILIEPIPEQARRCRTHRRNTTKVFEAACVSFQFLDPTIELLYSDTMTIALEGISDITDREEHAISGTKFLPKNVITYKFHALARTMTSILDEAIAPTNMSLLSLDVEGGELEVLRGIDHEKYRFDWMLIESRNIREVSDFLARNYYTYVKTFGEHDYLFRNEYRMQ